ncbi:MAG: DNA-binding protein, partial [Bacteroidetes bacterium]
QITILHSKPNALFMENMIVTTLSEKDIKDLIQARIEQALERMNQNQANAVSSTTEEEIFPPFMDIDTVSRFINLKSSYVYELVSGRQIPFIKLQKRLQFCKKDIIEWLNQHKIASEHQIDKIAEAYINKKRM